MNPSSHTPDWKIGHVQVYTGDGKGKTTAALGLALRAAGAGLQVYIAQFAKGSACSELHALGRFSDCITLEQFGSSDFIREPTPADREAAQRGLAAVRRVFSRGLHRLGILDEANIATWFGLIPVADLLDLIDQRPEPVELVLTGRRADPRVIARADLVTEMRQVKHYFDAGVQARTGIES